MHIHWVGGANHLFFCCLFVILPSIFPSFRVFSNESALCIRWPKYWSFSLNISPPSGTSRTERILAYLLLSYSRSYWKPVLSTVSSNCPHRPLSPQVHHCLPGPVLYYFSHELLQLPSIITFFLLLFSITDSFLYNSIWFLLCWRKEGFGVLGQSLYDGFSKNPQTLVLVLSDTGIFLAQFTLERAGIPWTKAYALMTSARELSGSRKAHSLTIFTFFLKYNHLWKAFTGHLSENWIPTGPDTPFSASFPS